MVNRPWHPARVSVMIAVRRGESGRGIQWRLVTGVWASTLDGVWRGAEGRGDVRLIAFALFAAAPWAGMAWARMGPIGAGLGDSGAAERWAGGGRGGATAAHGAEHPVPRGW